MGVRERQYSDAIQQMVIVGAEDYMPVIVRDFGVSGVRSHANSDRT